MTNSIVLALSFIASLARLVCSENISMPMPSIWDVIGKVHITSEVIMSSSYLKSLNQEDQNNYHNGSGTIFLNEYVDMSLGKQFFTTSSKSEGKTYYYIDSEERRLYQYRPYVCQSDKIDLVNFYPQLWSEKNMFTANYRSTFKWFGVSALWYKTKHAKSIFNQKYDDSIMGNRFIPVYIWTFDDIDEQFTITFRFEILHEVKVALFPLRTVELISKDKNERFSIIINVLEVERLLDPEVFDLPLGYGCQKKGTLEDTADSNLVDSDYRGMKDGYLLDMKITATTESINSEYDHSIGVPYHSHMSSSASIAFQFAHSDELLRPSESYVNEDRADSESPSVRQQLQMMLIRGIDAESDEQIKFVWDQSTGVKYTIDYRNDTCQQDSFDSRASEKSIKLEFKNGLVLELTEILWEELFVSSDQYYLVRKAHDAHYMEKNLDSSQLKFNDRSQVDTYQVSIVRRHDHYLFALGIYSIDEVTLLLYNNDRSHLQAKYVFQVDYTPLKSQEMNRQLFDVTPCFNQEHHQFVWVRFVYPLTPRLEQIIKGREPDIREYFAKSTRNYAINPLQLAKIEVSFNSYESRLIIRALILDQPSLLLQFERISNKVLLLPDTLSDSDGMKQVAHDEEHCSHLCELTKCKQFSFCDGSHYCFMVHDQQDVKVGDTPEDVPKCTLFRLDENKKKLCMRQGKPLHYIISKMQHDRYDENLYTRLLEQAQADNEYDEDDFTYLNDFSEKVKKHFGNVLLPNGTFVMPVEITKIGQVYITFVPFRFELESDPLEDLIPTDEKPLEGLSDYLGSLDSGASSSIGFYVIDTGRKYEINLDPAAKQKNIRSRLTYEECSLYCLDTGIKCDSFSYCHLTQDCTISLRGPTMTHDSPTTTTEDRLSLATLNSSGCVIVKRNYLKKFIKTSTYVSLMTSDELSKKSLKDFSASSASDCANDCIIHSLHSDSSSSSKSTCHSFDYCYKLVSIASKTDNHHQRDATCYLLREREDVGQASDRRDERMMPATSSFDYLENLYKPNDSLSVKSLPTEARQDSLDNSLNCDHYSRSYLADTDVYENRGYADMNIPETDSLIGMNVDECSKRCFHSDDCKSFQFCFDVSRLPRQSCLMTNATIDSKDKLIASENCHIYVMRLNSNKGIHRSANNAGTTGISYALLVVAFVVGILTGVLIVLMRKTQLKFWMRAQLHKYRARC